MKLRLDFYEFESFVGDSDSTSLNTSFDTFNFSVKCLSFNSNDSKNQRNFKVKANKDSDTCSIRTDSDLSFEELSDATDNKNEKIK